VIDARTGSVTVNRGSGDGVVAGDLFQVFRKGSPVSSGQGEGVIGYLKRPIALLQEQHAAPHSSRCSVISADYAIRSGMPVMRYSDMTAALVTAQDMKISDSVRQRFSNTLPALNWIEIEPDTQNTIASDAASMKAAGIDLLFYLSTEKLTVFGPGHSLIHSYPLAGESFDLTSEEGESGTAASASQGGRTPSEEQDRSFQWESLDTESGIDLGKAPVAGRLYSAARQVEIADMDRDGRPEAVYLVARDLYMFPFGTGGELLSWKLSGPGVVSGFYLCPGHGWIVVNVLVEGVGLRSVLLENRNNSLVFVQDDINLWLSFHDMDGDGSRETLLGQTFNLHNVWGEKVYRLNITPEGIEYLEQITVPDDFRTGWAEWGDVDGNGRIDICLFDRSGRAWLFEDGMLRWSTPSGLLMPGGTRNAIMHSAVADIYGNGRSELVFASSVHTRDEDQGRAEIVCCIRWEKGRFEIAPVTRPGNAIVAGLSVFDSSLLVAAAEPSEDEDEKPGETVMYRLRLPLNSVSGQ
jgi:hypothetical protein